MSVRKLTVSLLTTLVLFMGLTQVEAQDQFPADPFEFDPDFQWFEPVTNMDLADMKPSKRAHHGWFATYDRLMLYASRPELNPPAQAQNLEHDLDRGWGHRYHVGYMRPDDEGYAFTWTTYGVGAGATARRERINRFDDGGGLNSPFFPFEPTPPGGANNLGYVYRFINVRLDTYNLFDYDSYELNKTWRMEPYHYGGILEPMIGFRWIRFDDRDMEDQYLITPSNPAFGEPAGTVEQLTTDIQRTMNDMIGPQIGFRYSKASNKFVYGADLRFFLGGNFQNSSAYRVVQRTDYGGLGGGGQPLFFIDNNTIIPPVLSTNEEFYFGFDLRGELGYQLTRQLSLRTGFQLVDIAKGLWRGGEAVFLSGGPQDQDMQMFGATFGLNLNY